MSEPKPAQEANLSSDVEHPRKTVTDKSTAASLSQPKPAQECQHDLAERETACADGMCPICLREQLAAEREDVSNLSSWNDDYRAKLAAAVEALERIANSEAGYASTYKTKAKAALAKVKEGK